MFGVAFNRINVFLVAYKPLYAQKSYFPSVYEILLTAGLISALVLIYRLVVIHFPVISAPLQERPVVTVKPVTMPVDMKSSRVR